MAALIPGMESDGYDRFRVPREELSIPPALEFDRKSYQGGDDERRTKIRIKEESGFGVEKRKTAGERLAEKYPDGIDFSIAQVVQESDGSHVLIFGASSPQNEAEHQPE